MAPVNDDLADAILITEFGTISGTTVDSTVETGQETDDGYVNTVWYRYVVPAGVDQVAFILDPSYAAYFEVYAAVGSNVNDPPSSDPPADFADLTGAGYVNYVDGNGSSSAIPISVTITVAEDDVYYILVTNNAFTEGIWGTFDLTTTPVVCFDAADIIYGSSSTASVSGTDVIETQDLDEEDVVPYESITDLIPTLRLGPTELATLPGPGWYVVTIQTKSANANGTRYSLLRRNDIPFLPVTSMTVSTSSTPATKLLTLDVGYDPAEDPFGFFVYLPIDPDNDTSIDICVTSAQGTTSVAIVKACFKRVIIGYESGTIDVLDVPDYPLGTSGGDLGTADQQGDLIIGKASSPTFNKHRILGADMSVTDDGKIWVCHNQIDSPGGTIITGPILSVWDPSSPGWTTIEDDMESLGVKRSTNALYGISMDTDGTDLYIAYAVNDGTVTVNGDSITPYPLTSQLVEKIRVWKFEPSGPTFTDLGLVFAPSDQDWQVIKSAIVGVVTTPHLKLAPNGDIWVAFTQADDTRYHTAGATDGGDGPLPAYAAKYNGSTWDTYRCPLAGYMNGPWPKDEVDASFTIYDAQTYRNTGSGTTADVTVDSKTAVSETQTAYTNDTLTGIVPPAGDWSVAIVYRGPVSTGAPAGSGQFKFYKNGSPLADNGIGGGNDQTITAVASPVWRWASPSGAGITVISSYNGTTDTLELRMKKTGNAAAIHVHQIVLIPAEVMVQPVSFAKGPQFSQYTQFGQYHAQLTFADPDGGLINNPCLVVGYMSADYSSMPMDTSIYGGSPAGLPDFKHFVQFSQFDGSEFQTVWERTVDEDVPNYVADLDTTFGHSHQGMAVNDDGQYAYLMYTALSGVSTADTVFISKLTSTGMEYISEYPASIIAGKATSLPPGAAEHWSSSTQNHPKSLIFDNRDNLWYGFNGDGFITNIAPIFLGQKVSNLGITEYISASLGNNVQGEENIFACWPVIALSPDQTKLYILNDVEIYSTATYGATFGVWECDILTDQMTGLSETFIVPGGGNLVKVSPDGTVKIVSAERVTLIKVTPDGTVTTQTTTMRNLVRVKPNGEVSIIST